jgi:hypothetical protein
VTELCPVGSLLPTQYRFEGRPWEIVDVPTVCGLCPVGCNVNATVREGKVKRILSRNHPEIDEGWICDKGRFAYTHLRAGDRLASPLQRQRRHGLEEVSWEQAIDEAERLLRGRAGAWSPCSRAPRQSSRRTRSGLLRRARVAPGDAAGESGALTPTGSRLPDPTPGSRRAGHAHRRARTRGRPLDPSARRNGARIVGTRRTQRSRKRAGRPGRAGPRRRDAATVAKLAEKLGLAGRGAAVLHLPETPNGRGVADAWAACCDEEAEAADSIGLLVVSGDEAAADGNVRAIAEQAEATIVISMFGGLAAGWADLILPGTGYLEREGTFVNLEGRLQRLRRTVEPPCPDELGWISQLAARFGVDVAPYAAGVFAEVSERVYGGISFGEVGERAPLRGYPDAQEHVEREPLPAPQQKAKRGEIRLVKPLFRRGRRASPSFSSSGPNPSSARPTTAAARSTGDLVTVGQRQRITLPARVNRHLRAGIARIALEHADGLAGIVEVAKAEEVFSA